MRESNRGPREFVQHIDEHTLELFVLRQGDPGERSAIEAHLQVCCGCRDLAQRMQELYAMAEELAGEHPASLAAAGRALVRTKQEIRPWDEELDFAPLPGARGPLTRVRRLLRIHPVATLGGSFAFLAAGILLANLLLTGRATPVNPAYVSFSVGNGMVRIHARNDALIWEKPASGVSRAGFNPLEARKAFAFQDLDDDGISEVITGFTFDDEGRDASTSLKIFDWKKQVLALTPLNRPVHFTGRTYDPVFRPGPVCAGDLLAPGSGGFLLLTSNVRSPSFIARYDNRHQEAGAYWHFGQFGTSLLTDLGHDGKPEFLVGGVNDVEDSTGNLLPVLVVLDPARISGDRRTTTCGAYQLPVSDAELWYIAFPWSDLDSLEGRQPTVQEIADADNGSITVTLTNGQPGRIRYSFHYRFSTNMELTEVKATTETQRIYAMMRQAGRVGQNLDSDYLRRLQERVRYWSGEDWQPRTVRVAWDRWIVRAH
jgi:hypothetical protein